MFRVPAISGPYRPGIWWSSVGFPFPRKMGGGRAGGGGGAGIHRPKP